MKFHIKGYCCEIQHVASFSVMIWIFLTLLWPSLMFRGFVITQWESVSESVCVWFLSGGSHSHGIYKVKPLYLKTCGMHHIIFLWPRCKCWAQTKESSPTCLLANSWGLKWDIFSFSLSHKALTGVEPANSCLCCLSHVSHRSFKLQTSHSCLCGLPH